MCPVFALPVLLGDETFERTSLEMTYSKTHNSSFLSHTISFVLVLTLLLACPTFLGPDSHHVLKRSVANHVIDMHHHERNISTPWASYMFAFRARASCFQL